MQISIMLLYRKLITVQTYNINMPCLHCIVDQFRCLVYSFNMVRPKMDNINGDDDDDDDDADYYYYYYYYYYLPLGKIPGVKNKDKKIN